MKKTSILVVALVLSLIGNIWLGVQLNTVNNRAVTAMASVAAAEQTATTQGEQLTELTQKLADAEAKTQAVQAELDNITALQAEQAKVETERVAAEKYAVEQEAAKIKLQEQQKKDREAAAKKEQQQGQQEKQDKEPEDELDQGGSQGGGSGSGDGSGSQSGGSGGGHKEPAGGIASTPAGRIVAGGGILSVGEWNSEMGAWWATDISGAEGWLFPGGGFFSGW